MTAINTCLHVIGCELLAILAVVWSQLRKGRVKQIVGEVLIAILVVMLTHFTTQLLPDKIAGFIYSAHREYRSLKT